MTRTSFKYFAPCVLFLFLASVLIFPVQALTQDQFQAPAAQNATGTSGNQKNFCSRLDEMSEKIGQKLDQGEKWLEEKRTDRLANLSKRRQNRDERLSQFRDNWADSRTKLYERLQAKATSTEQQAAVAAFKTKIDESQLAEQSAIDAAIKIYRENMDTVFADRKIAVDKLTGEHRAAVEIIFQKADADCLGGIEPAKVRTQLLEDLAEAKNAYRAKVITIEKSVNDAKELADIRKASVDKAVDDYRAVLAEARQELKSVFNSD